MYKPIQSYLEESESLTDSQAFGNDSGADFTIHFIKGPHAKYGDRVFVDVGSYTEDSVLIGGNPLHLKVVQGSGKLVTLDLKDGTSSTTDLEPGTIATVPSINNVYRYEKTSDDNLVIQDTCLDFNPDHEPSAEKVVRDLTAMIFGPPREN